MHRPTDIAVAHVTAPAAFGGLERMVTGLANAQARRGLQVLVVVVLEPGTRIPAWSQALRAGGVLVEPVCKGTRSYLAERRAVTSLLRSHGTQLVHTRGERDDVVQVGTARRAGLSIVATVHAPSGRQPPLGIQPRQ